MVFNDIEGQNIKNLVRNSKFYQGSNASKMSFERNVNEFRIVHLAGHAKSDLNLDESSYIVFSGDEKQHNILYNDEIYGLNLENELVVLSGCETAIGNYTNGTGVRSLANSFTIAGAKSTISTLWPTNDEFTMHFMTEFYGYLMDGESRANALRLSKLVFLDHPIYRSPFYWSSFILQGEKGKIEINSAEKSWFILIISILLATFFVLIYRKNI